jgi:hypothetical protein
MHRMMCKYGCLNTWLGRKRDTIGYFVCGVFFFGVLDFVTRGFLGLKGSVEHSVATTLIPSLTST